MNVSRSLIIFQKNIAYGKVKTRLAATVGDEKALSVYQRLLRYTYIVTKGIVADKIVFYSGYIESGDWDESYQRKIQQGSDLGERMRQAFEDVFTMGHEKVIIIGTDCPELTEQILHDAFELLERSDVVIGPAADGGYYLLGMKRSHSQLFNNMVWSTSSVCSETLKRCEHSQLHYCLLPQLHDVDEETDLMYMNAIP